MISLAITIGDPRGIGPEITTKAVRRLITRGQPKVNYLIIGAKSWYISLPRSLQSKVQKLDLGDLGNAPSFTKNSGCFFYIDVDGPPAGIDYLDWAPSRSIEIAHRLCVAGVCAGMVTGPIDKEVLWRAGYKFAGHTDMLARLSKLQKDDVTMILASKKMVVALVTDHIPLSKISRLINRDNILKTICHLNDTLKFHFKIKRPKIAVLGLNPHASDGGLFGNEEFDKISPAIRGARKKKIDAIGPMAADGFFSCWQSRHAGNIHGIVAMYHDQGLIPLKLADFSGAINITYGLPYIRTSVDHGVAYDIAGKGVANPNSLLLALDHAARMAAPK